MADAGDNQQPTHSRKKQQLHPLDVWNDKAIATTEEDVLELCDEFLKDIARVGHCVNLRGRRKMGWDCVSVFRHREQGEQEESEDDALSNAVYVISQPKTNFAQSLFNRSWRSKRRSRRRNKSWTSVRRKRLRLKRPNKEYHYSSVSL
jgi:hypothetical protein